MRPIYCTVATPRQQLYLIARLARLSAASAPHPVQNPVAPCPASLRERSRRAQAWLFNQQPLELFMEHTVASLVLKYLAWCRKHRSQRSLEWYAGHLSSFLVHLGDTRSMP